MTCKACKFAVHVECVSKVPKSCGLLKNMKESLIQHDRILISEVLGATYNQRLPSNIERCAILKEDPCSIFIFNDSIVVVQALSPAGNVITKGAVSNNESEKSDIRYNVLCMVKWQSHMTNRQIEILKDGTKPMICVIPPRESDRVHLFTFENSARRDEAFVIIQSTVEKFLQHQSADADRQQLIQRNRMETLSSKTADMKVGNTGTLPIGRRRGSTAAKKNNTITPNSSSCSIPDSSSYS